MNRASIGIADIVRVTQALRPNAAAIEALARMCGMALVPEEEAAPEVNTADEQDGPRELDDDTRAIALQTGIQPLPASVRRLQPVRQGEPPIAPPADPLAASSRSVQSTRSSFEGLLDVRDAALLLRLAASVPMPTDRIDLDLVARELAYARPVTALPRLRAPSLAFGVQVLVDVGLAMQPFSDDQQALLDRVARTLREAASVHYFADDPNAGAGPSRRKSGWKRYALPPERTPLIALTDLGCGFPRRAQAMRAWLGLAERLRRRQCRFVVFAPVRLTRIPLALRRGAEIVVWDRSSGRRSITQLAAVQDE